MDDAESTPTFDTWESYFYAETYDSAAGTGTLVNKFGERDRQVLEAKGYARTARRQTEIELGQVDLTRTYDTAHLRAIHRHLFQDVYHWAGEFRTIGIQKGLSHFAGVRDIDRYLDDASRIIRDTRWSSLDRTGFAMKAAEVFAYVNQAHPFREGNGRASKVLMQHVSELSNFYLDYDPGRSGVSKEAWNQRSMLVGPDLGAYLPEPGPLVELFDRFAQPAPSRPPHPAPSIRDQARGDGSEP